MSWILSNWDTVLGCVTAILGVLSTVTAMTPTPDDDAFVKKIVDFLSVLKPKDAAGTLKMPFTSTK